MPITWVPRAPHQCWWKHFVMKNNPCLMHVLYDILLDRRGSRRSPKAHALLMNFLQDKTDQKCNTSKIYSMAASFILFSFLAFLSSFSQFFSCMCVYICSISLSPALSHSPLFMYYFWPAPKELLNFILITFTLLIFFF